MSFVFIFFCLINQASLTMNKRGDGGTSPQFVLILECESFTFLPK